jgi:hypothetical protein
MSDDQGDQELVNINYQHAGPDNEQDAAAQGEGDNPEAEDVTTGGVEGQGGMGNGVDGNVPEPGVPPA